MMNLSRAKLGLTFLIVMFSVLLIAGPVKVQAQVGGVSDARYAHLARGINWPFRFWYGPCNYDDLPVCFDGADFATMEAMGLTYVRIPIQLDYVMDEASPDMLNQTTLPVIDSAVNMALSHNLAVIVDIHSLSQADSDSGDFSGRLENEPAFLATYIAFWQSFATHFSALNLDYPDMVFFQPMNEPVFYDNPQDWLPMQGQIIDGIHAVVPDNTIFASAAWWASMDQLMSMTPYADTNVIYDFHTYNPFVFTHQGATFAGSVYTPLRNIPYPSSPTLVQRAVNSLTTHPQSRQAVIQYGAENWNAARLDGLVATVSDWAQTNGVRILCDEFGALATYAPVPDRALFIHDMRTALEHYGIGWAMWEYDSDFGLVSRGNGKIVLDAPVAQALGLTVPSDSSPRGAIGLFYDSLNFAGFKLIRTDPQVDFSWGVGAPDGSMSPDTFSARWYGVIEPLFTEKYTFTTLSSDGVRLYVNNLLIVNNWTNHNNTLNYGTINLVAGQRYRLRLDYYEYTGAATMWLIWSSYSQRKEAVPISLLYPVPPPNVNLIRNGGFANMTHWTTGGDIHTSLLNGVLSFYELSGGVNPATITQNVGYPVPANSPMRLTFLMGNSSSVPKQVTVQMTNESGTDSIQCTFTVAHNTVLATRTITGLTSVDWASSQVQFISLDPDGLNGVRLDTVDMRYRPDLTTVVGTTCPTH
jgi:aryl-phospho-beta-D-glucosidase BglC (GH1 family)